MTDKKIEDPHADREAEKYQNPIPSREYILDYLKECGRLVRRDELISHLALVDPEQQEALRRRLRAMERDGQIVLTRREGYGLPDKMNLLCGSVVGRKDGYGFVIPDDASDDLVLTGRQMQLVFPGDKVWVRSTGIDRRGRREATIVEVLERNTRFVVGRFFIENNIAFVKPSNTRIHQEIIISPGAEKEASAGQMVVAEILHPPTFRTQPMGQIVEVLGDHLAPGMEIEIAIRSYNLPHLWPREVEDEISGLSPEVTEADKANRKDLRHLSFVTIDGEDAKDFDDAVYAVKEKKRWRLWVAIADVSHYVKIGSELDKEAYNRATSVYFPGTVVPMLPELLSNGLCSLKPNVDRLSIVCEMEISADGKLKRYEFYPAVIESKARLTYTEVTRFLNNGPVPKGYRELLQPLQDLEEIYNILRKSRTQRGTIDFDTLETKVVFGPNRKIERIIPYKRTLSHFIIEECMLMANVAAAIFLLKTKLPTLYRVHESPSIDKINDLRVFLNEIGLRLPGKKIPRPADYAELLNNVRERPDFRLIQTVLLRSLKQAVYSPLNEGHFGLAFEAYTHFTSPIRRYPDLLVHRALRFALEKGKRKNYSYNPEKMIDIGIHCSLNERRADEATRDALDFLKCEYMRDRLGEEFEGIITNVTGFGLFVELSSIYVEGLLHITALENDYYQFDASQHRLRGERTGTIYQLGEQIRVRVARVDLESHQIDFELISPVSATKKNPKRNSKRHYKDKNRDKHKNRA